MSFSGETFSTVCLFIYLTKKAFGVEGVPKGSHKGAVIYYVRGGVEEMRGGHNLKLGGEAAEGGVIISFEK